jgi:DNA-directed RNA polymerase subunit RPC12/RpoP
MPFESSYICQKCGEKVLLGFEQLNHSTVCPNPCIHIDSSLSINVAPIGIAACIS